MKNTKNKFTKTLNAACKKGDLKTVKFHLKKKTYVNRKYGSNLFPLGGAVVGGHIEIVKYLLKSGARINMRSKCAWTPLYIAAQRGFTDIANILIKKNALLNVLTDRDYNSPNRFTPLHIACEKGHFEIIKLLVKAGAKINKKNGDGETPFDILVKNESYEIACYLALNGGKPAYKRKFVNQM